MKIYVVQDNDERNIEGVYSEDKFKEVYKQYIHWSSGYGYAWIMYTDVYIADGNGDTEYISAKDYLKSIGVSLEYSKELAG